MYRAEVAEKISKYSVGTSEVVSGCQDDLHQFRSVQAALSYRRKPSGHFLTYTV